MLEKFPRKKLTILPTPIHKLENLTKYLNGPEIYIKRDDLTGLALGGNKLRKLEFLIGDALKNNADTVITGGAEQSNHCRQTAAAASISGLECHLVLGGEEPTEPKGNYLLDLLMQAKIHFTGEFRKGEKIPEIAENLKNKGKKVYIIPYGGSNIIGALGYVAAMEEFKKQISNFPFNFDEIIFATSSGGTQSGMAVGKELFNIESKLHGIKIDKEEIKNQTYNELLSELSNDLLKHIGLNKSFTPSDFIVNNDYLGGGYGVIGETEIEAVKLCAKLEGIFVDPVYTGRAMGGLIDLIRNGYYKKEQKVLFWHTGGTPALFNYSNELLK